MELTCSMNTLAHAYSTCGRVKAAPFSISGSAPTCELRQLRRQLIASWRRDVSTNNMPGNGRLFLQSTDAGAGRQESAKGVLVLHLESMCVPCAQVMEEVMAKSKAARSARQLQRAEDLDATDALDAQFASLVQQGGLEGLVRPL